MATYVPTAWNTGDVITAAKLNNLETQYQNVILENQVAIEGKVVAGTQSDLVHVNAGDDAVFGSNATQDDTLLVARLDTVMKPGGTETGRFIAGDVFKMIQNVEVEKGTPQYILDRDGTGQYLEVVYKDGSTIHLSTGYDHTNDLYVIRNNGTGAAIFSVDPNTRWIETDNQPRGAADLVSAQTITASTRTAIIWDTSVYDNASILDIGGSNPTRLTMAIPGRYLITAKVQIDAGTGGGGPQRYGVFQHSGARGDFGKVEFNYQTEAIEFAMVSIIDMATTEYIELDVFHDSGASEGVTAEIQAQRLLG
jgi:hypothetical protein